MLSFKNLVMDSAVWIVHEKDNLKSPNKYQLKISLHVHKAIYLKNVLKKW